MAAGLAGLKIEGRLKTPEYVANVTWKYRDALDAALAGQYSPPDTRVWNELAQSFSCGLSPGFLAGVNHQRLVHGRYPKSRSLLAGRILAIRPPWVDIAVEEASGARLHAGDGVVFDKGDPERDEPGGPVYTVRHEGDRLSIALAQDFPYARYSRAIAFGKPRTTISAGDSALFLRKRLVAETSSLSSKAV